MTICFWQLCHCPEAVPCAEHHGAACSLLGGVTITKETDVSDALTGAIAVAIATMEGEKASAEAARQKMETWHRELEKQQEDLESAVRNATDRATRKALRAKAQEVYQKNKDAINELRDALDRYQNIVQYPIGQVGRTQSKLLIPFADPTGYCACYDDKQKRLAAIAGALAAEQANFARLSAELTAHRKVIKDYFKYALTLTLTFPPAYVWLLYVYLGLFPAQMGLLLVFMVVVLVLAALIIDLLTLERAVAVSQILILQLMLQYYRLQSIPTCQKAGTAAQAPNMSWWDALLKLIEEAVQPPSPRRVG